MGVDAVMFAQLDHDVTPEFVRQIAILRQTLFKFPVPDVERRQHSLRWDPKKRRVHVWTFCRYYGEGYERGPILEILAFSRFLEEKFAPCVIHYGGDHTDSDDLPVFDDRRRNELWHHFVSGSGREYFAHMGHYGAEKRYVCDFCDLPLSFNMMGRGGQGGYCLSCKRHWFRQGLCHDRDEQQLRADRQRHEVKPKSRKPTSAGEILLREFIIPRLGFDGDVADMLMDVVLGHQKIHLMEAEMLSSIFKTSMQFWLSLGK